MNRFDFTLVIDRLVEDLDEIDRFYGRCDDVSMYNANGVTRVTFHREADTLDATIRAGVFDIETSGYKAKQIEVEPDCVGAS